MLGAQQLVDYKEFKCNRYSIDFFLATHPCIHPSMFSSLKTIAVLLLGSLEHVVRVTAVEYSQARVVHGQLVLQLSSSLVTLWSR